MTPEREKELFELMRENNEILKKIRKSMFWSRVFRVIYILTILGVTLSAYYFIQPYLESTIGAYNSILEGSEKIKQTGSSLPDLSKFIDLIR